MKGHIFFCLASEHLNAMREKRGVKKKPDCCQIIENHHTQKPAQWKHRRSSNPVTW
jgi:hypothetical protein